MSGMQRATASAPIAESTDRKLKAHGSHPEALGKKNATGMAVPSDDDGMDQDMEVKDMFKTMMTMMQKVTGEVQEMKLEVVEAKEMAGKAAITAEQAIQVATGASEAVNLLR